MRRIVLWLASTVTVVLLLFSYPTSTNRATSTGTTTTASTAGTSSGSTSYTGTVASTRWGPVQVKIAVADHRVTAVTILQQPDGNRRDEEINAEAIPILIKETLDAQSATIDMVSGATVTSDGYLESLQAALDQAGI